MLCSFLGFCTRTGGRFEWQQKRPLLVIPFVGGCLPQAEYDNGEIEIICHNLYLIHSWYIDTKHYQPVFFEHFSISPFTNGMPLKRTSEFPRFLRGHAAGDGFVLQLGLCWRTSVPRSKWKKWPVRVDFNGHGFKLSKRLLVFPSSRDEMVKFYWQKWLTFWNGLWHGSCHLNWSVDNFSCKSCWDYGDVPTLTKGPASDASDKTSQLLMVSIVHTGQSSSVSQTNLTANCPAWRAYFHNWTRVHGSEPYIFSQFSCLFSDVFGHHDYPVTSRSGMPPSNSGGSSESVPGRKWVPTGLPILGRLR